jgi:hypothetical protein
MQYIEGGHPSAQQIGRYMKARGWMEHTDQSETQDYIHNESGQITRFPWFAASTWRTLLKPWHGGPQT